MRPLLVLCAATLAGCPGEPGESSSGTASSATDTSSGTSSSGSTGASTSSADPTGPATADATSASTTEPATSTSATTTTTTTTTSSTTDPTATSGEPPPNGCTPEALALVDLVNAYRAEKGLPAVPASPSLCIVGQTHVQDLADNAPHTQPGGCNLHSWSNAGAWTPCCYTPDHAQAMCMWIKPQELTEYPGYGYENAAQAGGMITPEMALAGWQGSPAHNDVILNQGIWASHPWGALGAGLHQGFAVLWFGEEPDPAG